MKDKAKEIEEKDYKEFCEDNPVKEKEKEARTDFYEMEIRQWVDFAINLTFIQQNKSLADKLQEVRKNLPRIAFTGFKNTPEGNQMRHANGRYNSAIHQVLAYLDIEITKLEK